ncbi:MAG: type II toxin-antitoxin system RelE/ParE family toxin, partial [Acidobacteria bacterium]|nr:type II toxin-antitoxin system RelE/ParE family toxin [Acidobacteriota bacterium]
MCVRVFKSRWFHRFARKEGIADAALREAVARAEKGQIDAGLGGDQRANINDDLRHSREMTLLCSAKVTHHHVDAVVLLPVGKGTPLALGSPAKANWFGKNERVTRKRGVPLALAWVLAGPCPRANRVLSLGRF